jgi:hypothetical protein
MMTLLEINNSDTPLLSDFAMRNHWTHIDERIDKYGARWKGDVITYEPPRVEPLSEGEREYVVFLGVDPEQLAVYHLKDFQQLEPIAKEVTLVHDAIGPKGFRKLQEGAVVPLYEQWK